MARDENKSAQVPADALAARIVTFLSNKNSVGYETVEDMFGPKYAHSTILSRFDKIIVDLKLNTIVKVVRSGGHVYLVKMTAPVTENDDENTVEDDDNGVQAFADFAEDLAADENDTDSQ